MGQCGGFGYALWATARNEAVHSRSVLISALWAIAQDWICAMGHSTGFGDPLWAVAKDLVKRYGL